MYKGLTRHSIRSASSSGILKQPNQNPKMSWNRSSEMFQTLIPEE